MGDETPRSCPASRAPDLPVSRAEARRRAPKSGLLTLAGGDFDRNLDARHSWRGGSPCAAHRGPRVAQAGRCGIGNEETGRTRSWPGPFPTHQRLTPVQAARSRSSRAAVFEIRLSRAMASPDPSRPSGVPRAPQSIKVSRSPRQPPPISLAWYIARSARADEFPLRSCRGLEQAIPMMAPTTATRRRARKARRKAESVCASPDDIVHACAGSTRANSRRQPGQHVLGRREQARGPAATPRRHWSPLPCPYAS